MRPSNILIAMLAAMVLASHSVKAADILPPKLESWTQFHYRSPDCLGAHEFQQRQRWEDDQSYKHISLGQVPIPGH